MSAYGTISDEKRAGLQYGLDNQIEGGWAAALAAGIEFGYPVFAVPGDDVNLYPFLNDAATVVLAEDYAAGDSVNLTIDGEAAGVVAFDTDHDTSMDLLLAACNALDGVEAVLDATDTDNRTIHIRKAGVTLVVTAVVVSMSAPTITATTAQIYVGISLSTQNAPGNYEQKDAVNVLVSGYVNAEIGTACVSGLAAYVAASGGKLANTGLALPKVLFRDNLAVAGIALVETHGKSPLGVAQKFA